MAKMEITSDGQPDHIVVLLHGIRTQAHWAEMVANVIETEVGARVQPVKYGFFDVVRFILPFWTRRAPVQRIIREYRDLKLKYPKSNISVVAHSFGTYAITQALEEPDIVFHRVVFCGSIAPERFRASRYRGQIGPDPILNDCGTHDLWPVLAKSIGWGYGATGTFGFGGVGIRDRFSKFSHSTYFKRDFVRDYWVPFLRDGRIVGTEWEIDPKRPVPPYWQSLIAAVPTRWIIALLPLFVLAALGASLVSKDAARLRVEQAYVGHWIGLSQFHMRLSIENKSIYNTTFTVTQLELAPPGEGYRSLNFERISSCNGSVPMDIRIAVEAGKTAVCDYSFLAPSWGMQELYSKMNDYISANNLQIAQPDPTKFVISGNMLEEVKGTALARFEWRTGDWRLKIYYNLSDHQKFAEYSFTMDESIVHMLRSQVDYYATGLGVFPNWRYLSPTGQPPWQQVMVRASTQP